MIHEWDKNVDHRTFARELAKRFCDLARDLKDESTNPLVIEEQWEKLYDIDIDTEYADVPENLEAHVACILGVLGSSLEAQEKVADIMAQIPLFGNAVPVSKDTPEMYAIFSQPERLYGALTSAAEENIGDNAIEHIHQVADTLLDIVQSSCGIRGRRCVDASFSENWRRIMKLQDDKIFRSYFSRPTWLETVAPLMLAAGASLREDHSCTVKLRANRKPHFDYGEFSDDSGNGDP